MSLSYDERSAIRWSFQEAFVDPERRRACRVQLTVPAKIIPWQNDQSRERPAIDVTIEDFSTTGVGLIHARPLKVNDRYLLEVPRPKRDSLWVVLRVSRCLPMDDGTYGVGLEACELLDVKSPRSKSETPEAQPVDSRPPVVNPRVKLLFLLFGIAGIAVAALVV
jgi:hypothetical protein